MPFDYQAFFYLLFKNIDKGVSFCETADSYLPIKIKMPNYRHIIWDFNGTLLDDLQYNVDTFNKIAEEYGLAKVSIEKYRQEFSFPVVDFYKKCGFDFSKLDFNVVGSRFIEAYKANFSSCRIYDAVPSVLEGLRALGFGQSLLSSCMDSDLRAAIDKFGLSGFFSPIDGLSEHGGSKTRLAQLHIGKIGVPKSGIVLVGDTLHDFAAASAAGVDCLLLACGHNSRQRLQSAAVPVFDNHQQLFAYLANSCAFSAAGAKARQCAAKIK